MKKLKTYVQPTIETLIIDCDQVFLAGSGGGGVGTGGRPGDEYGETDETYSRQDQQLGIWDNKW